MPNQLAFQPQRVRLDVIRCVTQSLKRRWIETRYAAHSYVVDAGGAYFQNIARAQLAITQCVLTASFRLSHGEDIAQSSDSRHQVKT